MPVRLHVILGVAGLTPATQHQVVCSSTIEHRNKSHKTLVTEFYIKIEIIMDITETNKFEIIPTGPATGILPVANGKVAPIKVIANAAIRDTLDDNCLQQAINSRLAPGVKELVVNPDAHLGYGAPVGCVMASPTHIYPGPVGVDIKCSMSLLQFDLSEDAVNDVEIRRALINAILERTPTGAGKGQRHVAKSRIVDFETGELAVTEGASKRVLEKLGIPTHWADSCEDAFHLGHDDTRDALVARLADMRGRRKYNKFEGKVRQLGSYGGGNHFGECEIVRVSKDPKAKAIAETFGLKDGNVAFLSHCGSRGFGHDLATGQFRAMQNKFDAWKIPYPSGDKQLCYAPLGSPEADAYIDDMSLGANFATVNHLLINALILEAFEEVLPGVTGDLVYLISHNIARKEIVGSEEMWVMRKGATRALPAGHDALKDTRFAATGHPILLPGDPQSGSAVMVAQAGAKDALYSVNHGAGRVLGRRHAKRILDQAVVDKSFSDADILSNCRQYPVDEAPDVYKDFEDVLDSVKQAGLAEEVARLEAKFVIKDASKADD